MLDSISNNLLLLLLPPFPPFLLSQLEAQALPEEYKGTSIQNQLEDVKKSLSKLTVDKLAELEIKLTEIEKKIATKK